LKSVFVPLAAFGLVLPTLSFTFCDPSVSSSRKPYQGSNLKVLLLLLLLFGA
jgi:hypothetical protein